MNEDVSKLRPNPHAFEALELRTDILKHTLPKNVAQTKNAAADNIKDAYDICIPRLEEVKRRKQIKPESFQFSESVPFDTPQ